MNASEAVSETDAKLISLETHVLPEAFLNVWHSDEKLGAYFLGGQNRPIFGSGAQGRHMGVSGVLVLKESKPGTACAAVLSWSSEREEVEWTNPEFKAQRIPALSSSPSLPTPVTLK